jgi:hypothetical protein
MCRYAMTSYKPHFACFDCRKTFKRRLIGDMLKGYSKDREEVPAKCPECANLMANMGLDFESPKKKDLKAWKHIETLYKVGITFHSCGCSGPGYIPRDSDELINNFSKIKAVYIEHQHFWARRRENPETQSEIAKDQHHNGFFLDTIPNELYEGTKKKPKYDAEEAQAYWNKQVREVERRIAIIRNLDSV